MFLRFYSQVNVSNIYYMFTVYLQLSDSNEVTSYSPNYKRNHKKMNKQEAKVN